MRFSSITFLLVAAGASFGLAAPAEAGTDNSASTNSAQWTCENGWTICGTCNGSSCKFAGIQNQPCDEGSCAGPDGGDGKPCGYKGSGPTQCPGF